MDRDPRREESQDADWIFASEDPSTLPTDRLPGRDAFDRYAAPLLARRDGGPVMPPGENETADLSGVDAADLEPGGAGDPSATDRAAEPEAATGAIPVLDDEGHAAADEDRRETDRSGTPHRGGPGDVADEEAEPAAGRGVRERTYARSGTTPDAEHDGPPPRGFVLPDRFRALGVFDALRDVLALICLVSALTTTFTLGTGSWIEGYGEAAIGTGLIALIVVHLVRWIPQHPPLMLVRIVRIIGLLPALLTAIAVLVADLVLSLPVLFDSLPDGPPVGIGVGVALLLLGAIVGIEPRAHEGFLPQETSRRRARVVLLGIGIAAAAAALLALVMIIGRIVTTGWAYSLMAFADAGIAVLLLGVVLAAGLRRERSWFVFSTAAAGGLVAAALADNTLRLQFAAPDSVATGYVYLPFLFAAFAVMISRSFVRTMPVSFRRADWLVYTVRAFEFSALMHGAAAAWHLLAAIAGSSDITPGGTVLHLMDAAMCACFVAVSLFARTSLLNRPADIARASGVIAGIVLVVVGFLDIIVNSLATGSGAGLLTGGAAMAIGIAAALMLTVPAPVRDEFGAPDLTKMFADFRTRDAGRDSLLHRVPDVTAERARRKTFPGT